ncbi:hypothetical protein EON73_05260 [bacterium]|nr:MAG: hypothetical protein EON73_05260 [bacterium]
MNLQEIFKEEPKQWGFRGDPFLWQELKELVIQKQNFKTDGEFSDFLKESFKDITGNELVSNKFYYIKRFDNGGMSGGGVSCEFWIETGFPLLISRFNIIKNKSV